MADLSSLVRTDYKAVDKRDPLKEVLGWVTGDAKKVPIVMDGSRPFGIVNERALMGRSLDANAHLDQFTLATRALPATAQEEEARSRLAEHRAAYLPVEDEEGRLAGYVRALDLARGVEARRAGALAMPVTILREDQTLGDALHAFSKAFVEHLPVAGADGRIVGVLPRHVVVRMGLNTGDKGRLDAGGEKRSLLDEAVGGVMEPAPAFVPREATFDALAARIEEFGYALVGDAARIEGIVTAETLFRAGTANP